MGNLNNLYISQSFQSLAHLGTNTSLVPGTMTVLQDGIGQSLNISFDGTNISSSGNIFAANITASVVNTGSLVTTSSFNAYSQSTSTTITNLSASLTITDKFLQDQITALDVSGAAVSLVLFNQFTASQLIINSGYNSFTSSTNVRLNNLETTSASVNISLANLNQSSASQQVSINNLNTATQSLFLSASLALVTASINNDDITFTKGDGSQFTIQVATGSFALSASYAATASEARNVVVIARNGGASTLPAGTVVHITSAVGDNPIFTTASYDTEALSSNTFGLLRYSSPSGADVEVVVNGVVTGVNTDPVLGYAAGDIVYLSSSGQFTKVQPQAPNQIVTLGQVLRAQQNNGSIYVSINNGWELNELHNVQINSPQTGDLLQYESASYGLWKNRSISGAGITTTSSFNAYTQSTDGRLTNIESTTASLNSSVSQLNASSASQQISIDNLNSATSSYVTETESGSFLITASFDNNTRDLTFTKGNNTTFAVNIPDLSGSAAINTGSFATTGSNNFVAGQTLTDTGFINQITLDDHSGSLVLFAKGFTSSSLTHISGSNASTSASVGNLIFKTNNNTADTIISGSNNIFTNAQAPTAGFKRYLSSNNINLSGGLPQISGSMQFSPVITNNYLAGNITMRGPVSASTYAITSNNVLGTINLGTSAILHAERLTSGLTMSSNTIAGTLNIVANQSFLTASTTTLTSNTIAGTTTLNLSSSAVSMVNNIINDSAFTFTNQYFSSSAGLGSVAVNRNNIIGQNNSVIVVGSQPATTTNGTSYSDNLIGGGANTLYADVANSRVVGANAYHSAIRNIIFGNNLIVSASSLLTDTSTLGSAYFGRFNDVNGTRDLTAETIFAVGTGTSTSARKTGFLIDSGSNTFVEGTLNVSGASSLNGNQTITGSLIVSSSAGQFNRFTSLDVTEQRIKNQLTFTGSRFSSVVSTSVDLENLSATQFGFNQLDLTDNQTGTKFTLNTNKSGNTTSVQLTANYTGSSDAKLTLSNTNAGARSLVADVDSTIINGDIKFNNGSNKTTQIVSVGSSGLTVSSSLVTANSVILVTTQNSQVAGAAYPAVVSNKTNGSFGISHGYGGNLDVAYLIINPG